MLEAARDTRERQALRTAEVFLSRWRDSLTVEVREDLAQEAAIIAWQRYRAMRNPAVLPALVRTISRRLRFRALAARRRRPSVRLDAERDAAQLCDRPADSERLEVAGVMMPTTWLLDRLEAVLGFETQLNAAILMAYYEGFSCAELAERYEMSEQCVKVRIHRSRRRVRRHFEARVEGTVRPRVLK